MKNLKEIQSMVAHLFGEGIAVGRPASLYEPINYALSMGGKRLRPTLLLAACQLFDGDIYRAQPAALCIETFHNFTLLHDDLMDRSPVRRGQPSVYCKWNDNVAILSGDTMLSLSWRYLLQSDVPNLRDIMMTFNDTCIGVMEGQQYDMEFEHRDDVTVDEYLEMIRLKTAVLIAGALRMGALYAQPSQTDLELLYRFGIHIGLAFQIQDDLLDAYGDPTILGKPTGSDINDNKKTMLYLQAMHLASESQRTTLRTLFSTSQQDVCHKKIDLVLELYNQLGVRTVVEHLIDLQFQEATKCLDAISASDDAKAPLRDLSRSLLGRER